MRSVVSNIIMAACASVLLAGFHAGCAEQLPPSPGDPPETITYYGYEVAAVYPHDPEAFTQGLEWHDGYLYEGTGLHGASSIRKVELDTGKVLLMRALPQAYFGEGVTIHDNRLIQLTWKSQVGFVYALDSFERLGDFNYLGQGWGITHDNRRFIMSDGSAYLRFLDIKTFEETGRLLVRYGDRPVVQLNELEYINGFVYANIFQDDRIAIICPESGYVVGWIDLGGLLDAEDSRHADVLNGVAYDEESDRIFVTGKRWPKLFEIHLVEIKTLAYPPTLSER